MLEAVGQPKDLHFTSIHQAQAYQEDFDSLILLHSLSVNNFGNSNLEFEFAHHNRTAKLTEFAKKLSLKPKINTGIGN